MARHVKYVEAKTFNGDLETNTGTLCKAVYDIVNGKTVVYVITVRNGQHFGCLIVYDDP